jgi:hypothetical protein
MMDFPELGESPVSCGSWICTGPNGDTVETFERERALLLHRRGWTVKTTYQHLADLNREIAAGRAEG